jgi:phosphoribosyl-ATP pyrophosphohydrolase/phosphoribosyl-AMP cyclohydrolase/histidinol dehydrogenase
LIPIGGAQAIAAMGLGIGPVPACDLVVGPGNAWVTAAKRSLSGRINIDMLAGPSELLIIADHESNPRWIAADMLAQAEHDVLALTILLSTSVTLIERVEVELREQARDLTGTPGPAAKLSRCFALSLDNLDAVAALANDVAPEHIQIMLRTPEDVLAKLHDYGSLFIGDRSAVVLADLGAGPNHILPTGGAARRRGGLSVFDFVRIRTWMKIHDCRQAAPLIDDAAELALLEGLPGHARAARIRAESALDSSVKTRTLDN